MFNLTNRHSNDKAYAAAVKKIEALEGELSQKKHELDESCKAQQKMSEGVRTCVFSLFTIKGHLQIVEAYLDESNNRILELIKENAALKSSGDGWFKRAIKLEFDVLSAQDRLKKIENERDMAVKTIERFQSLFISPNEENSRGEH